MLKFGKNMSKIGRLPIKLPSEVTVKVGAAEVAITGPRGTVSQRIPAGIVAEVEGGRILVTVKKASPLTPALYGTIRALLANMVVGVSDGWRKTLELVGAGYKAETTGTELILNVGFSHPVKFKALEGISFKVEKNLITIEGMDKEVVGRTAAIIRAVRPPEPYKGKGIKYQDEVVRRKAGKAAKTATVA